MANRKGIRLTCPTCGRNGFFTITQIKDTSGKVFCVRHAVPVEMVNLITLIDLTLKKPEPEEKRVRRQA